MNNKRSSSFWPAVTVVVAVFCLFIALPDSWKSWAPSFLKPEIRLGLDLAGGTQLDFRISEDEIIERKAKLSADIDELKKQGAENNKILAKQLELSSVDEQHKNLVEAIRTVLERRINSLGVSEATITPSYFGNEKHLLVECPGIIDVQRCIATVGKTIQLEFKEPWSGNDAQYEKRVRTQADALYRDIAAGKQKLDIAGQDLSNQLGVSFVAARPFFVSELPNGLKQVVNRKPTDPVIKTEGSVQTVIQGDDGQSELKDIKGIYLTKVLQPKALAPHPLTDPPLAYDFLAATSGGQAKREQGKAAKLESLPKELASAFGTMEITGQQIIDISPSETVLAYLAGRVDGTEEMQASHILVQYKGASRADATVTRTKEEAKKLAADLRKQIAAGSGFDQIARTQSDGPSKGQAGSLGTIKRGMMVAPFEQVAFALKQGQISDPVETEFGFHIVRADKAASKTGTTVTYHALRIKGADSKAKATDWKSKVDKGELSRQEEQVLLQTLFFSLVPTGWQDTTLNGQRFRSASVTADPVTNIPVVQIQFDEEGGKIFQELTKKNIGKQIAIFVGGQLVSAPTVQNEIAGGNAVITGSRTFEEAQKLATDLNTGAIPAPIYLSGQTTIEATLGSTALQQSLFAALVGLLVLGLFMIILYRLLGLMANLALLLYVIILAALLKLPVLLITTQHVVLTLAGIAGIILSIGMAVDANILAFERTKEEIRKGKLLKTAIDTGFKRAWPSVRDGNTSTLITCGILFIIGTSIIRGFAITLSLGIFVSLFTAMVVSHWLCRKIINSPLAQRPEMLGVKHVEGGQDEQVVFRE